MRALLGRIACIAAPLAAAACAHVEAPEGGPVPETPLEVVATRPDTVGVVPGWRGPAVIVFDRTVSRQGVEEAVSLSPVGGGVAVDHSGDEIRVQPRLGWQPGTIYHVEVAAGIRDRFQNRLEEPVRLVFSTGPAIPDTRAAGTVTDRIRGERVQGARVDAVRVADSLTYTTLTDSAGAFVLAQVPEGDYRVVAYRDVNRNRRLDGFEARDTARLAIAVGAEPNAALALLPVDTTAPVAGSARMTEEWVEVRFDDHLDPEQPLAPSRVTIAAADGTLVPVAEVRVGAPPAADTARADTAGAEADADTVPADTVPADTAAPRPPLPSQSLFVLPGAALAPEADYTVTVVDVRNLHGLVGGGEVPLRTPAPPPPAEEARPDPAADNDAPADPPTEEGGPEAPPTLPLSADEDPAEPSPPGLATLGRRPSPGAPRRLERPGTGSIVPGRGRWLGSLGNGSIVP